MNVGAEGISNNFATEPIVDGSIASELDLEVNEAGFAFDSCVFMGPYYTGRLLNNISVSDSIQDPTSEGSVNGRLSPTEEPDHDTTACIVRQLVPDPDESGSSVLLPVADGVYIGGLFNTGDAATQLNSGERQVCYPYPIQTEEDGGGGIIDGELVPGTVDSGVFEGYSSVDFERLHSHGELHSTSPR